MRSAATVLMLLVVTFSIATAATATDNVAVYRLANGPGYHFYTANCTERISVQMSNGYKFEGKIGYISTKPVQNSAIFYRLYNGTDHFYTANATEKDKAVQG